MKKLIVLLAVVLMVTLTSSPAFAQGRSETAPNCFQGLSRALTNPGADNRSPVATLRLTANLAKCGNAPVVEEPVVEEPVVEEPVLVAE